MAAEASARERMRVRDLLAHLRLHWQIMLMPLFLWGFLMSAGPAAAGLITPLFWLVLFIVHVMFYGGSTALNSYYDRDEGPVGGLWHPPPVTRDLLYFAAGLQILGLVLLFFISIPMWVLAMVMGAVSTAYSHPAVRLKARPWASLLAVSIFQGMGGAAAGWLFAQEDWRTLFTLRAALVLLTAALTITGFYPLTQLYQREQDRKAGVISFAVYWGAKVFPLTIACFLAAAALMGVLVWQTFGLLAAVLSSGGLVLLAVLVAVWWRRYDDTRVRENYVWMTRLGFLMTAGFLGFIVWQLIRGALAA
jgi:1,4-dihydroxy-2-naphthoate octaprenyltransferase